MTDTPPSLSWTDAQDLPQQARWRSEAGVPAPRRLQLADDTLNADTAYRLACEGTGLLWQGDFHNARQLLQALARRVDRKPRKLKAPATTLSEAFHQHRQGQAQRARVLGLVRVHEWRKKGVPVPALGPDARIHPYYGVFSPVRGEYVDLVAKAPWPAGFTPDQPVFDIGVGTGVLSAVLAKRGARQVVATDQDPRALACAGANLNRLKLSAQVQLQQTDLFPPGQAALVVCNPPWLPARPSSPIEYAVYDPDSRMLRGFLQGLATHLSPDGEAWLILSDLAELLGLRSREQWQTWAQEAGIDVVGRRDARPQHPKASDPTDPLHKARSAEVTSLWRLRRAAA